MKQEFNWAMDQVKLPPEAEERILRALEDRAQAPRRKRRKGPLIAVLAAAAVLLMGAAAVWQSNLFQYFDSPGGNTPASLSQYSQPIGVSSTSEGGWTLTVDECIGDDQWVFLWMTLTAPENTELPVLGEGESFYLKSLAQSNDPENLWAGYGVRDILYDTVPGDNQIQIALGMAPDISPRGQTISLTIGPLDQRGGNLSDRVILWNETLVVENISLDYPETTTYLTTDQPIPFIDGAAQLIALKISPFGAYAWLQTDVAENELVDPWDPALVTLELHKKDGTSLLLDFGYLGYDERPDDLPLMIDPSAVTGPFYISASWDYKDIEHSMENGSNYANLSTFIDPGQIDSVSLNGVEIPFVFDPKE